QDLHDVFRKYFVTVQDLHDVFRKYFVTVQDLHDVFRKYFVTVQDLHDVFRKYFVTVQDLHDRFRKSKNIISERLVSSCKHCYTESPGCGYGLLKDCKRTNKYRKVCGFSAEQILKKKGV
ncbi:MAG: hypothetical protein MJZ96_06650, partial [Paludibacteraceae bacterium]|nr:hypothetical protein [Paludibacteraceae bacterium]